MGLLKGSIKWIFLKNFLIQTLFRELIDNNCIYVDKTEIISKFAVKKGPFFYHDLDDLVSLL